MNMKTHLSTSTPASEISAASFGDDGGRSAESEAVSLADIMRNSPVAKLLGTDTESQSEEENTETPGESSDEQEAQETDDESENEANEEESNESDEESNDEDDTSTQQSELPAEEDIDWEYKVPVPIDGKVEYKTLAEIRKGFATDQHLSQKGRELGELKKQVEKEREEGLQEIVHLGTALNEELTSVEGDYEKQYHKLTADIEKARDDGDSYTARELKDKRDGVQEQYWKARNKREGKLKDIAEKLVADTQARQTELVANFNKTIKDVIPDYSDKVASAVRAFALKEGVPESLLGSIYEPSVVKFINDYRKLKQAKETGEVKRKAAPVSKSTPAKKGTPASVKAKQADTNLRSKVFSGNSTNEDQMSFLKNISSISRKL